MGTEEVEPWEGRLKNALCKTSTTVATPDGVIPTVVIANTSDATGKNVNPDELRGIVFHGYVPVEWYCVASDEVDSFKTWVACRFPSVQIVTPGTTTCGIICPPPPQPAPIIANREETVPTPSSPNDLVRENAQTCARMWFVEPSRPA